MLDLAAGNVSDILATFDAILRIAQIEAGTRRGGFERADIGAPIGSLAETYAPVAKD